MESDSMDMYAIYDKRTSDFIKIDGGRLFIVKEEFVEGVPKEMKDYFVFTPISAIVNSKDVNVTTDVFVEKENEDDSSC